MFEIYGSSTNIQALQKTSNLMQYACAGRKGPKMNSEKKQVNVILIIYSTAEWFICLFVFIFNLYFDIFICLFYSDVISETLAEKGPKICDAHLMGRKNRTLHLRYPATRPQTLLQIYI